MKADLTPRWAQELHDLKERNRFRQLTPGSGLSLAGNDYLNLSDHPALVQKTHELLSAGIPLGSTGSRLLSGTHRLHLETEEQIAIWKQSEAALLFNSGYDANTGVISTLIPKDSVVFSDKLNHACIVDGLKATGAHTERFRHLDMTDLESRLKKHESDPRPKFLIVESVYSMDGDKPDFSILAQFCDRYGLHLMVDEAHGTGVFGKTGAGVLEEAGMMDVPLVTIHTCGKALGVSGAFVTGSRILIDKLINSCRNFIYTTAMPPIQAGLIGESIRLVQGMEREREYLKNLSVWSAGAIRNETGFSTGHTQSMIIPVIIGSDAEALRIALRCREAGFDVRPVRPPTVPEGTSRLRLSLHTRVTRDHIKSLIHCIQRD